MSALLDPALPSTKQLIQRWIGAPENGNLNDPNTVAELLRDVVGLDEYLREKAGAGEKTQVAKTPDLPAEVMELASYPERNYTTPNKGGVIKPLGVLWHASYGSPAGTLDWIQQARARVSYHTVIFPDGSRHNVVPLNLRAWHAGVSAYKGRTGCNNFMVGVSFTGNTYDRTLTDAELASAKEFVAKNKDRFGWTYDWVTDHRTVAPNRKPDLNPVEFKRLQNVLKPLF